MTKYTCRVPILLFIANVCLKEFTFKVYKMKNRVLFSSHESLFVVLKECTYGMY